MFIFRETPQKFWELLVQMNSSGAVSLWKELPLKYSLRIVKQADDVFWVQSSPHLASTRTTINGLKEGIWICEGDCRAFGGVQPSLFGIPLETPVQTSFTLHKDLLLSWSSQVWIEARVGYHGTSYEHYQGICASGFKCTFGMLGTGVYLGSFWKACRFAARDQEYVLREKPTVLRVVWTCKEENIMTFPRPLMYCLCCECYLRPEQRSFCGHTLDWKSDAKVYPKKVPAELKDGQEIRYWAGYLKPTKFPNSEKTVTQNEEWVLNPSCIVRLSECVTLNLDTVAKPHYDPLQRDIKIL